MDTREIISCLAAGGLAGVSVDLTLYPLDTIKTRLQSAQGFARSGSFRGIYAGVPSAAIGSFPNAAAFFVTYETVKSVLGNSPVSHMAAASIGESVACVIRVPVEVIKQRAQVTRVGIRQVLIATLQREGVWGLYRGFRITIAREVPFSFVQFPLWELLKGRWASHQGCEVDSLEAATCGAVAGGIAAAVTTPFDVAKTRIMLAKAGTNTAEGKVIVVLLNIWRLQGFSGLFAGIFPRVAWISLGGFIFLGAYDKARHLLLLALS